MEPFYQDELITLYKGDAREIIPALGLKADVIIADPPYGETSLVWDRWPDGWPKALLPAAPSMWCFGSLRMYMERATDFAGWKLSQDVIWEKHNAPNAANDRFKRVHEIPAHFYDANKKWADIYKSPQFTNDATAKTIRRKCRPPQWGNIKESFYVSEDGGPKLMRSVLYARSCHGHAIHPTQKPASIVQTLMLYAVPPGGSIISPFAGSGTDLIVARSLGIKATGIELQEAFCNKIVKRLSEKTLFDAKSA